ncbi:hypothetical protein RI054_32g126310 [Pseudoscourfieldia marina]
MKVCGRLPRWVRVASPFDEVLVAFALPPSAKDTFDCKLTMIKPSGIGTLPRRRSQPCVQCIGAFNRIEILLLDAEGIEGMLNIIVRDPPPFFGSIIVNDCSSDLLAVKCANDALINERLRISAEVASDETMRFKALHEDLRSVWGMYSFNSV